jgi:hypothetical protein
MSLIRALSDEPDHDSRFAGVSLGGLRGALKRTLEAMELVKAHAAAARDLLSLHAPEDIVSLACAIDDAEAAKASRLEAEAAIIEEAFEFLDRTCKVAAEAASGSEDVERWLRTLNAAAANAAAKAGVLQACGPLEPTELHLVVASVDKSSSCSSNWNAGPGRLVTAVFPPLATPAPVQQVGGRHFVWHVAAPRAVTAEDVSLRLVGRSVRVGARVNSSNSSSSLPPSPVVLCALELSEESFPVLCAEDASAALAALVRTTRVELVLQPLPQSLWGQRQGQECVLRLAPADLRLVPRTPVSTARGTWRAWIDIEAVIPPSAVGCLALLTEACVAGRCVPAVAAAAAVTTTSSSSSSGLPLCVIVADASAAAADEPPAIPPRPPPQPLVTVTGLLEAMTHVGVRLFHMPTGTMRPQARAR